MTPRKIPLLNFVLATALAGALLSLPATSVAGPSAAGHGVTHTAAGMRCASAHRPGSRQALPRVHSWEARARLCARPRRHVSAPHPGSPAPPAPAAPLARPAQPARPVAPASSGGVVKAEAEPIGEAADPETNADAAAATGEAEPEEDLQSEVTGASFNALVSGAGEAASPATPAGVAQITPSSPVPAPVAVGWGGNSKGELGGGFTGATWEPMAMVGLQGVKQVVATYHSTFILLNNGTVLSLGGNVYGQLGDGTHLDSAKPMAVTGLGSVSQIAAGGAHAMALLSNGTVETWGSDMYGQLGNGTTGAGREMNGSAVPVAVPGLYGVVAIAAGGADDAALLGNGTVMAWGENKAGQLGDGTTAEKDVPTRVRGMNGVRALALGGISSLGGHMLALLNNGTVMAVGANGAGQLGAVGDAQYTKVPLPVRGLTGAVVAISASISHSLALTSDGSVWAWGSNLYGELGQASGETCEASACSRVPLRLALSHVSAISAGFRFSLAISNGTPLSWGWNYAGRLGDGTRISRSTPASILGLTEASAISAGEFHSVALVNGPAPPPPVAMSAGRASLTVSWRPPHPTLNWTVAVRATATPTGKWAQVWILPPSARTYTIPSLTVGQRYEVMVRSDGFGSTVIAGTPVAG